MKIKSGFVMRKVGGEHIAVPIQKRAKEFNGLVRLNKTAAFLFTQLDSEKTPEELTRLLAAEYGISEDEASQGVHAFLTTMQENNLLEKT